MKDNSNILAIGTKILLFLVLAGALITNTGVGECSGGGFNCCDYGSGGGSGGSGQGSSSGPTTTPADVPVTMHFLASLDSITDWKGPLTFSVNGVTYDSIYQEVPGKSLQTVTVTYISGGPPRCRLYQYLVRPHGKFGLFVSAIDDIYAGC